MDQQIDEETLSELAREFVRRGVTWSHVVNGQHVLHTREVEFIEHLQKYTLRSVHKFVSEFVRGSTRFTCLLIITRGELKYANDIISKQQTEIGNLSKQMTEMDADIKTLNEKMAVLIDALSTLDQKS